MRQKHSPRDALLSPQRPVEAWGTKAVRVLVAGESILLAPLALRTPRRARHQVPVARNAPFGNGGCSWNGVVPSRAVLATGGVQIVVVGTRQTRAAHTVIAVTSTIIILVEVPACGGSNPGSADSHSRQVASLQRDSEGLFADKPICETNLRGGSIRHQHA